MSDLIDREALKPKIHYTDDYYETPYVEWDDILEQPTIPAPRWVRCEEDKPKERDYYFAFTADAEAFVGEYIPSVDQWWKDDYLILTVTHWMPIEPPKEDA